MLNEEQLLKIKKINNKISNRTPIDLGWDSEEDLSIIQKREFIKRQKMDGSFQEIDLSNDLCDKKLEEYFISDNIQQLIHDKFKDFILNYTDHDGNKIYFNMLKNNEFILNVSHLASFSPLLYYWVSSSSNYVLPILNDCLKMTLNEFNILNHVHVSILADDS